LLGEWVRKEGNELQTGTTLFAFRLAYKDSSRWEVFKTRGRIGWRRKRFWGGGELEGEWFLVDCDRGVVNSFSESGERSLLGGISADSMGGESWMKARFPESSDGRYWLGGQL